MLATNQSLVLKRSCVTDMPAGYGSSSEEFSDGYDEEEDAGIVNYAVARNSGTVNVIPAVEPLNSISGGASVMGKADGPKFVWTRDSCAKRAVPLNDDSSSSGAAKSKLLTDISSGNCADSSDVFSRKPSKTKGSATGGKREVNNWSWVERILAHEANKSTVPYGSEEVGMV